MTSGSFSKRKPWSQPLGDLVGPCLGPAAARYGFDEADLLLFWPDIVGARLAERCQPMRLAWPPRVGRTAESREAATLVVRVEGAFAVELQHRSAVVIERVNAHVGWRCVERLALRQAPLVARRREPFCVPSPDPAAVAQARHATADIADEGLREALARLGSRVFGGARQT